MKRFLCIALIAVLFLGASAGAAAVSVNKVSTFARETNEEKTALVAARIDETLDLLADLSHDEYIRDPDIPFIEKAQFLTDKNNDEQLGYMMLRILDKDINIYREGIGLSSNLGSRDYMQEMYDTGEAQVTDAFLAGADGKTINYTVTTAVIQNGEVTSALMAAVYGDEIDEFLSSEDSINVLVGSKLQYMGGIDEDRFGLAVAQVLESESNSSRPVELILLDFYEKRSGDFWGFGSGLQYFVYSPVERTDWVVMTEVDVIPMVKNILIAYGGVVFVLLIASLFIPEGKKKSRANDDGIQIK